MAYNSNLPNDVTVTVSTADIRENFRALKEDKIVDAATAVSADSATVSESCSGNAASATKLETARTINGVAFDGTKDITLNDRMPVGSVIWYAASTPPEGFLECNGQSTDGYPNLALVVGPTVPDLRGAFIRGWNHDADIDIGRSFRSLQTAQSNTLAQVQSAAYSISPASADVTLNIDPSGIWSAWHDTGDAANSSGVVVRYRLNGLETRPRNIALLPCIKY